MTTVFTPGDGVVIRATVLSEGVPVSGATVHLSVTGPTDATLTTGPSDTSGIAEAVWSTQAPNKRGQGGTPTGSYTISVTGLDAAGHAWDGVPTSFGFTLTTAQ